MMEGFVNSTYLISAIFGTFGLSFLNSRSKVSLMLVGDFIATLGGFLLLF